MKIDDYAQQAITTLSSDYAYGDANAQLMGMVLGLGGESGEVLEKFKKLLRDHQGTITEEDKQAIIKELGEPPAARPTAGQWGRPVSRTLAEATTTHHNHHSWIAVAV